MIKTVSLETAKLLKEAGFRQDTEMCWWYHPESDCFFMDSIEYEGDHLSNFLCSAPITDELLEELPADLYEGGYCFTLTMAKNLDNTYCICYAHHAGELKDKIFDDLPLPEALAQMWLWLKKEKLIPPPLDKGDI